MRKLIVSEFVTLDRENVHEPVEEQHREPHARPTVPANFRIRLRAHAIGSAGRRPLFNSATRRSARAERSIMAAA